MIRREMAKHGGRNWNKSACYKRTNCSVGIRHKAAGSSCDESECSVSVQHQFNHRVYFGWPFSPKVASPNMSTFEWDLMKWEIFKAWMCASAAKCHRVNTDTNLSEMFPVESTLWPTRIGLEVKGGTVPKENVVSAHVLFFGSSGRRRRALWQKENSSCVKMLKSGPVHYMESATDYLIYNFLTVEGVAPHSHDASEPSQKGCARRNIAMIYRMPAKRRFCPKLFLYSWTLETRNINIFIFAKGHRLQFSGYD